MVLLFADGLGVVILVWLALLIGGLFIALHVVVGFRWFCLVFYSWRFGLLCFLPWFADWYVVSF